MMIVHDLKDFYSEIKGKRVLMIVNYDVDAICACKILQTLFKTDYTLYTLVPVDVTSDLKLSVSENHLDEKYIIFINCGGTIDLVELLLPEEDITLFVLDSHRPLDVCNIYNPGQVKILSKIEQEIPAFSDIFTDEEDESEAEENSEEDYEDESEEFEGGDAKRRRVHGQSSVKKKTRREWEEKRDMLLFQYMKCTFYGRSSALDLYELAWKMSKDNFDLLWYAIVGLSEQLLLRKVGEGVYVKECGDVQNHIARLTHRSSQLNEEGRSTSVRIEFENDLRLALIRHWTVKASLTNSAYTATTLRLWTFQGEKRLHELLAEIGIPLIQCNQKYGSMDLIFKKEFQKSFVALSKKYKLDKIEFLSFLIQHGFRAKYSAMDFVYGLLAVLQSHNNDRPKADCFLECLEALCRTKKEKLDQGIDLAKKLLTTIFKNVQNALETKQIQNAGPFLYLVVQEGNADPMLCSHPYGILLLAEFAVRAFAETKGEKFKTLPLVISTPCIKEKSEVVAEDKDALCHITGVAPLKQDSNINFFGQAFRRASEKSLAPIIDVYFDCSVIKLNVKDRPRFLDALAVLLTQ